MGYAATILNPGGHALTAVANEALTAGDAVKLVAVTGSEDFRVGVADTAASDIPMGVCVKDTASGALAAIQPFGLVIKGRAGDTVTLGAAITFESAGGLLPTTTVGDYVLGTALNAATDGQNVYVLGSGHMRYAATS